MSSTELWVRFPNKPADERTYCGGSDGTRTATSWVTGRRSNQLNYAPRKPTTDDFYAFCSLLQGLHGPFERQCRVNRFYNNLQDPRVLPNAAQVIQRPHELRVGKNRSQGRSSKT